MATDRARVSADRTWATTIFAGTFLFRWLTLDFENDYFMHVAWAAEMLRGGWPVRDFVEPGFPLQTTLAYLGLRAGGYQLAWEGALACAMIAAGASFTFLACRRLDIPRTFALAGALLAIAAYPRLYAYPKAVAYPAALWALALYVSRPSTSSLLTAGAIVGGAFLLRHDHGVYTGAAIALGIVLFHRFDWRSSARALVVYGGTAALVVAPWLAWVQASGHAGQYWEFLTGQSRGLATGQRAPELSFNIDVSQPFFTVRPVEYPVVGLRWAPETSHDERRAREQQYALERLEHDGYRLTNTGLSNVRALVQDPFVEDTRGIDRGSLRVPDALFPWAYLQLQRYVPIVRARILPGIVNASNALPWLAWVTFAVPFIVLAMAVVGSVRRTRAFPESISVAVAAAVLSAVSYQTLVRASPDSRLGDVAAATGLLIAWAAWRAWGVRGLRGVLTRALVVVLVGLTIASAMSFGRGVERLATGGVDGPTNIVRQARARVERYGARPLEIFAPAGTPGLPRLAQWLNTCTREDARVAVLGFEPQIPVIAERGFAGGMAFYDLGWMSTERDQRLIIERWTAQDVPAVLAIQSEWGSFSRDYAMVRAFIDREYHAVQRSSFGGAKEVTVFVKTAAAPKRTDPATNLPCYR